MRLRITFDTENHPIPFEYHRFLQAVIYRALSKDMGDFLHDQGYGKDNVFKMFVYSELEGKYRVQNKHLIFHGPVNLYISSVSAQMMNELFLFFNHQEYIYFNEIQLKILEAVPIEDIIYHEDKIYELHTLSPIVCYKTDERKYTTFFVPGSREFEESLQTNLKKKYKILYGHEPEEIFEIQEIMRQKKTIVKYKQSLYQAYLLTMRVHVSDAYLKLLMHTGLGARNSSGFGMVKINDKERVERCL